MSIQDPGNRPTEWGVAGDHERRIRALEAQPDCCEDCDPTGVNEEWAIAETLMLDTRTGSPGTAMTTVLVDGRTYQITVQGTFNIWGDVDIDLGSPEPDAMFPTPGVWTHTEVGQDAEVRFAATTGSGYSVFPAHYSSFQMNLGSGLVHVEPVGGPFSTPETDHLYTYLVTGEGVAPVFWYNDGAFNADNYGYLEIVLYEASGSGCVPNPATEPDGSWIRTLSGAYVFEANPPELVPAGGSTGQTLVKSSGTDFDTAWGTPTISGGSVLLYDYTVAGSDKASIDTQVDDGGNGAAALPTTYRVLEIFALLRTDDAAAVVNTELTFNNDTGTNYVHSNVQTANTTVSGGTTTGDTKIVIRTHGSGGSASYASAVQIAIPAYGGTAFYKSLTSIQMQNDATNGNNYAIARVGTYLSTTAISRLKVAGTGAAKLKVGSRLIVFGR